MVWRRFVLAVAVALGSLLAGCGAPRSAVTTTTSTVPKGDGVVTGVAADPPVSGPPGENNGTPVTVTLTANGKTVASQTVTGEHIYRFIVAPGLYVVSSSDLCGVLPSNVSVQAGEVLRANLGTGCI